MFHLCDGWLVIGGWDDCVMLWSLEFGVEGGVLVNGYVSDVVFSVDGGWLLVACVALVIGVVVFGWY